MARRLVGLRLYVKRGLVVACDLVLLGALLWGLLSLRHLQPYVPPDTATLVAVLSAPLCIVITFAVRGLYRLVTRFMDEVGGWQVAMWTIIGGLVWSQLVLVGRVALPRSVVLVYGPLAAGLAVATRKLAGALLRAGGVRIPRLPLESERRRVVIYGAGRSGIALLAELVRADASTPVAFIDSDPSLWGRHVRGVKVHKPDKLAHILTRSRAHEVVIALPERRRDERRAVVRMLNEFPVTSWVLPDVGEMMAGRMRSERLRPVEVTDLLGRERVEPLAELMARYISGRCILVTGAGGSIGAELVRLVLRQCPRRVVLLELSEAALYDITSEIQTGLDREHRDGGLTSPPQIVSVLGSVLDEQLVTTVLRREQVDVVYHAAAYKHVPIVEENPLVALANNVLGLSTIARAARAAGIARFVLISTDKAVRPTNVMGASKRLSELVLQALAAEVEARGEATVFTSVRFGNVLNSSGSVVRLFRQQIEAGGPVTVTDREVTRFFMSLQEASELVIQAGAMARGGEVFLLEMGEPVKIDDLARLMIRLAGLEVRSEDNPEGHVAIEYVGLRAGEKLHEELLIGDAPIGTEHPRIWRQVEPCLAFEQIERELRLLAAAIAGNDVAGAIAVLLRTVEGFTPDIAILRANDGRGVRDGEPPRAGIAPVSTAMSAVSRAGNW